MKIKIISIDQDKSRQFADIMDEYIKRTSWKIETLDLQPHPSTNSEQQKEKECASILKHIKDDEYIIALDPTGKQFRSEEFSESIKSLQETFSTKIVFIIGGAFGISNEIKKKAKILLSLSKMTMPHRIAKLVLLEQLYRSYTIMQGHPYHK